MATMVDRGADTRVERGAVFSELATVRRVIVELREAGFTEQEIIVVSDSATVQDALPTVRSKRRAGSYSPAAIVIGSISGLVAGGVVAGLIMLFAGEGDEGLGAKWMAALIAPLIALTGGFCGAMLSRGAEVEATNYHDQSLLPDQILIVAEGVTEEDPRLQRAVQIFAAHGAEALPLSRG